MTDILVPLLIVIATVMAMEGCAWAAHRYIMHGFGWGWHRSHHEPREGAFERNDLYAVVFALVAIALMASTRLSPVLFWIGLGVTVYGVLYSLVHDGLVHQRWPFRHVPRSGYLKHLYQAHKMHHAVEGREGCVSFGFLYAPPLGRLKRTLQAEQDALAARSRGDRDRTAA